jgi:hypothetical protein
VGNTEKTWWRRRPVSPLPLASAPAPRRDPRRRASCLAGVRRGKPPREASCTAGCGCLMRVMLAAHAQVCGYGCGGGSHVGRLLPQRRNASSAPRILESGGGALYPAPTPVIQAPCSPAYTCRQETSLQPAIRTEGPRLPGPSSSFPRTMSSFGTGNVRL